MALVVKGEGTAEFRGAHSCRVEFQVLDDSTGEIRRERATYRVTSQTKAEKSRCLREFRAELEGGTYGRAATIRFRDYAAEWLATRKADKDIAEGTYRKDETRVAVINLTLGDKFIDKITRADVKAFQAAIVTPDEDGHAPTTSGRPLSGAYAHGIRVTLGQIFEEAVEDGLIDKNPCHKVKAPKVDTKERTPLTPEEAARFRALLDNARPRPTLVAFRLCLFAGLRRGEACALRWSDFDAERGEITVRRSLCASSLQFKEPKTEAGCRTIPLDAGTVEYLKRFRTVQAEKLLKAGRSVADACICADANADYMHPENVTRSLARFGKANGFEGITPHILRHTYCTLLFAAGADLKTTQYLMGHSDPATTLRVYTHYMEDKGAQAAQAVGALMDSLPTTNVIPLDAPKGRWGISARVAV